MFFRKKYTAKSPVLLLTFNRPDLTEKVIRSIREAKPPKLYFASDGPRNDKDTLLIERTRNQLTKYVDWDCKVEKLEQKENLGCKVGVSTAISWFFEKEEMGIVLEDDTVPENSFFYFMDEMLNLYKDEKRIGHISGTNYQRGQKRGNASYYFSVFNHIWGWGGFRRSWSGYDHTLSNIEEEKIAPKLRNFFHNDEEMNYWIKVFKDFKTKNIDTCDFQYTFWLFYNEQLTVIPQVNLVTNFGFGADATHTKEKSKFYRMKTEKIDKIIHPEVIERNMEADQFTMKNNF